MENTWQSFWKSLNEVIKYKYSGADKGVIEGISYLSYMAGRKHSAGNNNQKKTEKIIVRICKE